MLGSVLQRFPHAPLVPISRQFMFQAPITTMIPASEETTISAALFDLPLLPGQTLRVVNAWSLALETTPASGELSARGAMVIFSSLNPNGYPLVRVRYRAYPAFSYPSGTGLGGSRTGQVLYGTTGASIEIDDEWIDYLDVALSPAQGISMAIVWTIGNADTVSRSVILQAGATFELYQRQHEHEK